jgi:putative addiction module CopG family antidote
MSVDLFPDNWNEIGRQVAAGIFATPDDVVREALAALRDREREVAAIQEGIDNMETGRLRSFHEFDREIRQRNVLPADS